jgi:hypothetical protein
VGSPARKATYVSRGQFYCLPWSDVRGNVGVGDFEQRSRCSYGNFLVYAAYFQRYILDGGLPHGQYDPFLNVGSKPSSFSFKGVSPRRKEREGVLPIRTGREGALEPLRAIG